MQWDIMDYLIADVANTCPLLPTDKTTMDATTTIKSVNNINTNTSQLNTSGNHQDQ